MNILFVCYTDFRANSLTHIAGFARGLSRLGHSCAVAVPEKPATISAVPDPAFKPLLYAQALRAPSCFPDGRPADLIHAWTPRWHVAEFVLAYQRRLSRPARLVVHLEDNEEHLAAVAAGRPFDELRAAPAATWPTLRRRQLVHPVRHRLLLHAADAITLITPSLAEFAPPGRPARLLRPAVDEGFFGIEKTDTSLFARLGIPPGARLIVHPGGANPVNAPELLELYAAAALLDEPGRPVRLVRTGASPRWFRERVGPRERDVSIDLGFVDRALVAPLLGLADVLVQPGEPGPFNDYRLPSKLAEFLAAGKPVLMPRANIAAELRDGHDALFLRGGGPAGIAARCREVFADPDLALRLGANARVAARRLFDPSRQCELLADIHRQACELPPRADWAALAKPGADERALFPVAPADADLASALRWLAEYSPPRRPSWLARIFAPSGLTRA